VLLVDGVFGSAVDGAVLRHASGERSPASGMGAAERAAIVMKVAGGGVAAVGILCLGGPLAALLLRAPDHAPVLAGALAAGWSVILLRSLQLRFQIEGRYAAYGAVEIVHTLVRAALVVAALAAGARSACWLIAAYAVAPLLVLAGGLPALTGPSVAGAWYRPREWRAFASLAGMTLATCAVGAVVARLDLLVLAAAGEPHDLGLFGIASTVAMVPTQLGAYLAPSLTPRIVPYCRDGRFAALFVTTQTVLVGAALAMLAAALLIVPAGVAAVLPPSYARAVPVASVLMLSSVAGFVTFPLTLHFLLFFSPRTFVAMDLASLPLLVPAYAYAARHHGALGVAWVTAVAGVTKAAIAQARAVRLMRRIDVPFAAAV
jgi:PST family polysaccharide transporter